MTSHRILSVLTLICALVMSLPVPTTKAEPVVSADPTTVPAPVAWRQLGQADKIVLTGSNLSNDVELALPAGVIATTVTGLIGSVVNVAQGRIDVTDSRGVFLGAIPVPTDTSTVPFAIDTAGAAVVNGAVKLSFILRENAPPGNSCATPPSVTLTQLATTFSGMSPDPVTVSDFRPGYLARFVIWVGPNAPQVVQQAALSLVASLGTLYRPIPVRIDVDTADQPQPVPSTDTRLIEIRQGPRAGMTVRDGGTPNAALVITGNGEALQNQIALFSDNRIDLAQSPTAAVTSVVNTVRPSAQTLTFNQLGMVSQVSALGTTTLYTAFDATAFGVGQIEGARLHLIARYTPVVGGEGSILLRSGSTVLATKTLDASGLLDLTADVPADAITSRTGLALDVRYSPRQECAPLNDRITLALDPSSTVTVIPGTDNRGGFPSLPMALTPEFTVALGNPDMIRYAAQAIGLLGQSTNASLRPVVRSLDSALKSGSPLLIVADRDQMARTALKAPIQAGAASSVTINGDPVTTVDLNGPLGVIQAFTDRGRSVLAVNGSDDWSLVDRSFDYIRGQQDGWSSLSGDVIATGPTGTTVNLTVREGGPMTPRPIVDAGWRWWIWLTLGVAIAAAIALAAVLVMRRRRHDGS